MRRIVDRGRSVTRTMLAVVVLAAVPVLFSGCIVWLDDVWCDDYPPRVATVHVYALDYYTGTPIPWAVVELYERGWWDWDYVGRRPVDNAGYAIMYGGYLYRDECGGPGDEADYRVVVMAEGYYSDYYQLELSYHHPWETLTFYMLPWYGLDAQNPGGQPDGEPLPPEGSFGFPKTGVEELNGRIEIGGSETGGTEAAGDGAQ